MGSVNMSAKRPRIGVLLLALAFAALATPTMGIIGNGQFAAWQPDHGHVGTAAAIAHHTHSYDTNNGSSGSGDVVFTPSDDGSVATAITLAAPIAELAGPTADLPGELTDVGHVPAGIRLRVPVPPPRA